VITLTGRPCTAEVVRAAQRSYAEIVIQIVSP
jgi:hypothetical protein